MTVAVSDLPITELYMERGGTLVFDTTVTAQGVVVNLSTAGTDVRFGAKKSYSDTTNIIDKALGGGITLPSGAPAGSDGIARTTISGADTTPVTIPTTSPTTLVWDLWVKTGGKWYPVARGLLYIRPAIALTP